MFSVFNNGRLIPMTKCRPLAFMLKARETGSGKIEDKHFRRLRGAVVLVQRAW
jgi:hypothetical protein